MSKRDGAAWLSAGPHRPASAITATRATSLGIAADNNPARRASMRFPLCRERSPIVLDELRRIALPVAEAFGPAGPPPPQPPPQFGVPQHPREPVPGPP